MYAPFDAYVSRRFIDNFVNVDPGAPIVRLLDLNKLLVVTSITENLVATGNAGSDTTGLGAIFLRAR